MRLSSYQALRAAGGAADLAPPPPSLKAQECIQKVTCLLVDWSYSKAAFQRF